MKKYISWNVNGLRACMEKGFMDFFHEADADAFCLQETKLQEGQISLDLPGYKQYWNYDDGSRREISAIGAVEVLLRSDCGSYKGDARAEAHDIVESWKGSEGHWGWLTNKYENIPI